MNLFNSCSGVSAGTGAFLEKSTPAYAGSSSCGPPARKSGPPRPRPPPRPAAASGGVWGAPAGAAVLDALAGFLHCVGTFRDLVFELDRPGDLPLVLAHHLEDLLDRCFACAPRQIKRAMLRCRAILQVEAPDPIVVLLEELHRGSPDVASRHVVAEIDIGFVPFRQRKRLVERCHAALQVRVIRRADLLLHREIA